MNCPRCGRSNPADASFCIRCGQRLVKGTSGVTYRQRQRAGSSSGTQYLIALALVLIAGVIVAGGGLVLLNSSRGAPPTPVSGAIVTMPPSLEPFVQPTPTPAPLPSPSPTPLFLSTVPPILLPSPNLTTPTPNVEPPATPTATPTKRPTATPTKRPTTTPTPGPTQISCAASAAPTREIVLGVGNPNEAAPANKAWCVHRATIRIEFGSTFGEIRLLRNNRTIAAVDCRVSCERETVFDYSPPRPVRPGDVLRYRFTCTGDPSTPEDECSDDKPDGARVTVEFEPVG